MRQDYTYIAVVLDRSGSMSDVKAQTIDGFNEFLNKQQMEPGDANLYFAEFDDKYDLLYDKPIKQAHKLTEDTFQPRGMTALYDAIGKTIVDLGEKLSKIPEPDRPGKVLVAVITDGYENASHKYDSQWVANLIKEQRTKYNWDFVFIGSNQDAIFSAAKLGIVRGKALTYTANNVGSTIGATMSAYTTGVRGQSCGAATADCSFDEEERKQAVAA